MAEAIVAAKKFRDIGLHDFLDRLESILYVPREPPSRFKPPTAPTEQALGSGGEQRRLRHYATQSAVAACASLAIGI